MSQPRIETIELTRGDDYAADIAFDQPVAGFASMRFTIREEWARAETDNSGAVLTLELTPTGTNTAALEISSAQSLALQFEQYVHDIQVVTVTGGKKYTTQRGPVIVGPDVTR